MPLFDYRCGMCVTTIKDVWTTSTTPPPQCPHCKSVMEKVPAAPAFTVTGFNAANRYSNG